MFTDATNYLPASNTDTHALVAYGRFDVYGPGTKARLYSFKSFDMALAAYEAAVAWAVEQGTEESQARMIFAVRSMDDPSVRATGVPTAQFVPRSVIANAVAKYLRDEENETVKWALKTAERIAEWTDGPAPSFDSVVTNAMQSLKDRGFDTERWRVADALKARVIVGRCHHHSDGRRAFFFKKSTGARLAYVRCPVCGSHLSQTSMALDSAFIFITDPVGTYFETTDKFLPGEKRSDREKRHDRVDAAREAQFS